jgi:nucleoside phosphorylase
MSWSFERARRAAAAVRADPLGSEAVATLRPRSVNGLVRERAPLSLLLYIADRDGLVTKQDDGGFAVLQRPAGDRPIRSGGYAQRLLRWLDRRWDFVCFFGPPVLGMLIALLAALAVVTRVFRPAMAIFGLLVVTVSVLWVCAFMISMIGGQLWWVARLGAPSAPGRSRGAESLPFTNWSVRLVHQPDVNRLDELMGLLTERLVNLVRADLQASAGDRARTDRAEVTAPLVVLTRGISTAGARTAIAESLRAIPHRPAEPDVIVLAAPARLDRAPREPVRAAGKFVLLYAAALAIIVVVDAMFVASAERGACAAASCAGRPATYRSALRYLLQRLLFSDPSGLSPGTTRAVVLGWLVSVAAVMFVVVLVVAGRMEITRNRQMKADYDETVTSVTEKARVLILVVTDGERQAVLEAVRGRVGQVAVLDQGGERTIYTLGSVANTELMLAQAAEQGTAAAAGMLITASEAIIRCRPDYVILTGICYGLRPEEGQQTADIVVARRMQNADHVKVTDDQPVIHRGVNVGCSAGLLDRFQAGRSGWTGAQVHFGTMLCSNTLVNSRQLIDRLRQEFPDAIAGEMEGAGVYEAASRYDRPDWIIVKAISDWGYGKNNDAQALAARNAAEFVVHVIAASALRRRRHDPAG